ncbi:hypothetical protein [Kitasatospora sp. GP82]|uniref:hypothetical protein n=1 Tax=Kitasatospora sp. GP82 TaxID=3035089 RepID=UPI0024740B47|nr:hypothetical protein [Kitasatospora sp. GP82]MDH6127543.1 hypothetical protein [Kitasatospora sp. GP82]
MRGLCGSSPRPGGREAGGDGTLGESERDEPARLRRQAAEQAKRVRELEMERDVLKRCMVLWVK